MKINPREKRLATIAAAALAALLVYQFIVAPVVRWQRDSRHRIDSLGAELADAQTSLRQRELIEDRYRRMAVNLHQVGTNEAELSRLLQSLDAKRSALPLIDKGMNPLRTEERDFYHTFRIAIEVEGPLTALADYLHAITATKDPLRIEQMTIRSAGADARREVVRGSIIVSAVYTTGGGF